MAGDKHHTMSFEGEQTAAQLFEESAANRRALDEITRVTAEVIIDIQDKGALYRYALDKRNDAITAMQVLSSAPPTDTPAIIEQQAVIRLYTDVCDWIHRSIDEGEQIAEEINSKEYGRDESQSD